MKFDELTALKEQAAWKLIFPPEMPFKARPQHPACRPWVKPSNLPLDNFIADLATSEKAKRHARGARLKTKSELASETQPIVCPYYYARLSTFYAVRQANRWVEFVRARADYFPVRMKKLNRTNKLADSIDTYRKHGTDAHALHTFPDYSGRSDPNDQRRRKLAYHRLRELLDTVHTALREHADQIEQDCGLGPVHGNTRYKAWKRTFAAELGYCWTKLTGKPPTLSSTTDRRDFQTFVAKAFVSIGGGPQEKWIRAIRDVLHDRARPSRNSPRIAKSVSFHSALHFWLEPPIRGE